MSGLEESDDVQKRKEEAWFAVSAQAFGGKKAWSLMHFGSRDTLVWEMET